MITVEGLQVVFGRTVALSSLDLTLQPGVTGVFGPNGSGKSTLLRVLAGLLEPTAGRVLLEGAPMRASDERFRARVGYAGHQPGLYARLTVRENLELFATLHGVGAGRVDEALEGLGLVPHAGTHAGALSAGFKRRAAVARASLHEPDVLLLDEPYANLDDDAAELVSAVIMRWRYRGRVALVATHGAKRVKAYASGSLILQGGRAVSHRARAPAEAAT